MKKKSNYEKYGSKKTHELNEINTRRPLQVKAENKKVLKVYREETS